MLDYTAIDVRYNTIVKYYNNNIITSNNRHKHNIYNNILYIPLMWAVVKSTNKYSNLIPRSKPWNGT